MFREPPTRPREAAQTDGQTAVLLRRLYTANATVLLLHQVDAAYWQEWKLFRLPGGVQLFVALNLPIVYGVLRGTRAVSVGARSAPGWSGALAAAGLFAVVFHTAHLSRGDDAFRTPVSIGLLAATGVLSAAQVRTLAATRRSRRGPALPAPVR